MGAIAHRGNDLRIGAACIGYQLRSGDMQVRERFRLPTDTHLNPLLPFGQRHILDKIAQQLFALGLAGRRCMPDRRNILSQGQDALSFLGREEQSRGFGQGRISRCNRSASSSFSFQSRSRLRATRRLSGSTAT